MMGVEALGQPVQVPLWLLLALGGYREVKREVRRRREPSDWEKNGKPGR